MISERFLLVCMECLGPLSRTLLVKNKLTSDLFLIFSEFKCNPIESLVVKTIRELGDGRISFVILFYSCLAYRVTLSDLYQAYMDFDQFALQMYENVLSS